MKGMTLLLCSSALGLAMGCASPKPSPTTPTLSSFDAPTSSDRELSQGAMKFESADLDVILPLYAEMSGRSIIRAANLRPGPITFRTERSMNAVELLRALDTVLAAQGITTIFLGNDYVKFVREEDAPMEAGPVVQLPRDQLPDSSSYLTYIVKLKNVSHSRAVTALQPFAKMPNSILAIGPDTENTKTSQVVEGKSGKGILVLRDYSSNVRRMLLVLEKMEAAGLE